MQTPYRYRCVDCSHLDACTLRCADDVALRIEMEGPDTVAAVFMEPLQNTGGAFAPPEGYWARIREICDHYDVLLVSDEVICAFGRLGHMFGSLRYGYQPDMITFAKGVTSGYAPLGGVMISDRIAEAFMGDAGPFMQGQTFGGHPVSCAVANANLDIFEREDVCGHVLANEGTFKSMLQSLRDIPLVGDVRGDGYFHAIELVPDQATRGTFTDDEAEWLLRKYCRPVVRGGPDVIRRSVRSRSPSWATWNAFGVPRPWHCTPRMRASPANVSASNQPRPMLRAVVGVQRGLPSPAAPSRRSARRPTVGRDRRPT